MSHSHKMCIVKEHVLYECTIDQELAGAAA